MRVLWVSLSLLVFCGSGCVRITSNSGSGKASGSSEQAAEKRWTTVEETLDLTVTGMKPSARSRQIHGDRARSGSFLSHSITYVRESDWSDVAVDPAGGGPVGPMLELARRQEAKLREAGFVPLASEMHTLGEVSAGESKRVQISTKSEQRWGGTAGTGSGGYSVDIGAPRIVYWRLYMVPDAGASLGARLEYDRSTERLLVELSYNDRSVLNARYPGGSALLHEEINR